MRVFAGEGNFLKKVSFPRTPILQKLLYGKVFNAHSALDRDVRTNQSVKVFARLFQKAAQVKGA